MLYKTRDPMERFWSYVQKTDTCWMWIGTKHNAHRAQSSGTFSVRGVNSLAHRFLWEHLHGPLPPQQRIMQRCGNTLCVNPDHLYLMTQEERNTAKAAQERARRENREQRRIQQFWMHVDRNGDCWEWQAARFPTGYGRIRWHGKPNYAHRIAYELTYGPMPPELCVCHHCDNPPCVNPAHLFLGTHADNMHARDAKGRHGMAGRIGGFRAKLTPDQVRAIRERYIPHIVSHAQLAREFGVSESAVQFILARRSWRRLE